MNMLEEEKNELIEKLESAIYRLTAYYTSSMLFREDIERYVENAIEDCEAEWE